MLKFSPTNLRVFVCSHIFSMERPILLITNEDGDWMFLCGSDDHSDGDCLIVGVAHLIDRDYTLVECADLPIGFEAERKSVEHSWVRGPFKP